MSDCSRSNTSPDLTTVVADLIRAVYTSLVGYLRARLNPTAQILDTIEHGQVLVRDDFVTPRTSSLIEVLDHWIGILEDMHLVSLTAWHPSHKSNLFCPS